MPENVEAFRSDGLNDNRKERRKKQGNGDQVPEPVEGRKECGKEYN
jgi:hypothetical protein